MNDRIDELAKQAGLHREWYFDNPEINKFAELIIEEVMLELFINGHEDAVDFLNKHFGFEE